jgi:hypothetical protein
MSVGPAQLSLAHSTQPPWDAMDGPPASHTGFPLWLNDKAQSKGQAPHPLHVPCRLQSLGKRLLITTNARWKGMRGKASLAPLPLAFLKGEPKNCPSSQGFKYSSFVFS